jgi:hypothetical protein
MLLKNGRIKDVNSTMLFPLLRWCSSSVIDVLWCQEVNKNLFFVDKDIIKGLLYIGLRDKNTYIKYPKPTKEKDDKIFELKKTLAKKYYSWSEQEFNRNISNLPYINWQEVLMALGCEPKEYKLLGLKFDNPKFVAKQKICKKPAKTLMDF